MFLYSCKAHSLISLTQYMKIFPKNKQDIIYIILKIYKNSSDILEPDQRSAQSSLLGRLRIRYGMLKIESELSSCNESTLPTVMLWTSKIISY